MTIRLRKDTHGNLSPDRAIYFERRYRSARISPVILSAQVDLERVIDDFTLYWLKSERYQQGKSETIELTPLELKAERLGILTGLMSPLLPIAPE
jgi:hypothetical protein